jgi:hypothetical protein
LTTEREISNQPTMNRHIWELHAAVFELARMLASVEAQRAA